MRNKVNLYMAHPIAPLPEPQPKPVIIHIFIPVPDLVESERKEGQTVLDQMRGFYGDQADALVDALYHALPQGTFDRVVLKMFEKKIGQSLYCGVTNS